MKIIRLLSLLMIAALGFTSCGEDTPEDIPFTMGEFVVNREVIGAGQAFETVCLCDPGTHYDDMGEFWYSIDGREIKRPRGVSEPFDVTKFDILNGNGIVQCVNNRDKREIKLHVNGLEKGEHIIEFIVTRIVVGDVQFREEDVTMRRTLKVNIVDSDVRSSFWGESLEDTKQSVNLESRDGWYTTTDDYLFYGNYVPYMGQLDAYYQYTDNRLTGVTEIHKLFSGDIFSPFITMRFFNKVGLIRERTSFNKDVKFGFYLRAGALIEEKHQNALERLAMVTDGEYDSSDLIILGNAVLAGKTGLKYTAKSDKTLFEYIIIQNDEDQGVSDRVTYSPLP